MKLQLLHPHPDEEDGEGFLEIGWQGLASGGQLLDGRGVRCVCLKHMEMRWKSRTMGILELDLRI